MNMQLRKLAPTGMMMKNTPGTVVEIVACQIFLYILTNMHIYLFIYFTHTLSHLCQPIASCLEEQGLAGKGCAGSLEKYLRKMEG